MLSFELSYDELLTYQGTNPRPADFDAFWDKALLSLDDVPADAEFVDADDFPLTTAVAQHLYFTGTGGYRVHAKVIRPTEPTGPAVLLFHGYGGEQPKWVELLPYAARGYTVAALDVREQVGFRTPSQERNTFSLHHHLVHGLDDGPTGCCTSMSSWTRGGSPTSSAVYPRSTLRGSRRPGGARAAVCRWWRPR